MTQEGLNIYVVEQNAIRTRYRGNWDRCSSVVIRLVTKLLQESGITTGSFGLRYVGFKKSKHKDGIWSVYIKNGKVHVVLDDESETGENATFSLQAPGGNASPEFLTSLQSALERLRTPPPRRSSGPIPAVPDVSVNKVPAQKVAVAVKETKPLLPTPATTNTTPTTVLARPAISSSVADDLEFEILEIEEAIASKEQALEKAREEHRLAAASLGIIAKESQPLEENFIQMTERRAKLEREIAQRNTELRNLNQEMKAQEDTLRSLRASKKGHSDENKRCEIAVQSATAELHALQERLLKKQKSLEEERQNLARTAEAAAVIERLRADGVDLDAIRQLLTSK